MGIHKAIETPEKMWELFEEYVKHVKANPFEIKDWVGQAARVVMREKEKPLTIEGFECYLDDLEIINNLSNYFANSGGAYTDYKKVCARIRKHVRRDQIEGGMAGIYNSNITQRLNGLVEKTDNTNHETGNYKITMKIE